MPLSLHYALPMPRNTRDYLLLALAALVVVLTVLDVGSDLRAGTPLAHIFHEALLVGAALTLVAWVLSDLYRRRREVARLRYELEAVREAARSRSPELRKARAELSDAIDAQFTEWGLSPSEREVGRLLLKGLSIKEIAALRETHEKTVRQHASAIYHKAGLPGRHAFAAWFLEDLLG